MSEKINLINSRHDVESSGCSSVCDNSDGNAIVFKEPSSLSERKYSTSINDKIAEIQKDFSVCEFNPVNATVISCKNITKQEPLVNSAQISFALSQPCTTKTKENNCQENEGQISLSNTVSLTSVGQSDALSSELSNVEEWLKNRSDSLSSLDFDNDLKPSEIDVCELFSIRSSNSSLPSNATLESHPKIQEMGLVTSTYNNDSIPSSSGFMLSSLNFESDGSLSSVSTNGGYDVPKSKISNINTLKKENFVQVDKGLFEEMLLTDSKKRTKDTVIGEEKGLFEELLLPGVQEWLLTVSTDKKDSLQSNSDSVPTSPNCMTSSLQTNVQDFSSNKVTFDEYDLIGRNINTLKLMTPQEIENLPSRSLDFDENQLKAADIVDNITDLPFESCDNKDLTELPHSSSNEIDHKLFSILAMDASNDTLDNDNNNFSENILDTINPEHGKTNVAISENFNFNIVSSANDSNSILNKKLKNSQKVNQHKLSLDLNSYTKIPKDGLEKNMSKTLNLQDLTEKQPFPNVKFITKHSKSKLNTNVDSISSKNSSLPVGAIQLKLSSPISSKDQISSDKKVYMNSVTNVPNLIIKPISVQSSESPTLHISQSFNTNMTENHLQPMENLGNMCNGLGLAKINIAVDYKVNSTNISIISSNKEHTVFKINTSDLLRAVSSIKEQFLEPLGLKLQQLIEPTHAAFRLFSIHSHFALPHIKKNDKNSQNYEINYLVQEIKEPLSKSGSAVYTLGNVSMEKISDDDQKICDPTKLDKKNIKCVKVEEESNQKTSEKTKNNGENVGISLIQEGSPTMVSVPSVLDALSGPTTSNMNLAQVLASCDLSTPANENGNQTKSGKKNSGADEKTNNALVQLGINPETLSPNIGPKGNKRWPCPIASCSKFFPKLSYLKVHILNHKGIRPYKCSYDNCDWSFYTSYKLKRHLETHLNRRDFVCTEQDCNRRFTTIYNLNTHMTLHKRPKSWLCSLSTCGKAFHTRRELEAHMKLHSDVKPPYTCSVEGCSKSYFTPTSLASHMRSHHKEEELSCQWAGCGKKFDKPCRLKTHMRVHTGHRPYVCDFEGCNWRFQCASKLSRHQRKHTNDRKFSCPICKKAFLRSEHLKGHLLTHTGVRNFQCPIPNCEAKFTAKSSLYVHLKKHKTQKSDVKIHCPIEACSKVYDSKFNLRQHLLKNHTPIIDSNQFDYITLFGDKEIGEQHLNQTHPSAEVHKSNVSSFIPISLQSNNLEISPRNLGVNLSNKNNSGAALDSGENIVVPVLSLTSVQLSSEAQRGGNIVTVPEGFLTFSEGDTPSQTNAELGFPDLLTKDSFQTKGNSKELIFQEGSAARTDVLGNIILSQRAKRRQHLNLARKIAASNDITKVNFPNEFILPSTGDTLPISAHLQSSLIQEDGMTGSLFDDPLISREIMSDPAIDSQSTINLRDLE